MRISDWSSDVCSSDWRIVSDGHRIGNHSWSHPLMTRPPLARQIDEIARTDEALAAFDGLERHLFRPPSGALPLNLLLHFARERRTLAYWSYDSHEDRKSTRLNSSN